MAAETERQTGPHICFRQVQDRIPFACVPFVVRVSLTLAGLHLLDPTTETDSETTVIFDPGIPPLGWPEDRQLRSNVSRGLF